MTESFEPEPPGHVLVTGATGVLRPAARALAARGYVVTAVARGRAALADLARAAGPRLHPLAADFADPGLDDLLGRAEQASGPFTGALLYCPTAPPTAVRVLAGRTPGNRTVRLVTSAWAEPPADRPTAPAPRPPRDPGGARMLLLGWHAEGGGADAGGRGTRWHTPEEISDAALGLFDAPDTDEASRVLGVVRPWSSRPA